MSVTQPRGFEFPTFTELVPPPKLVWSSKGGGITWEEYTEVYLGVLGSRYQEISDWMDWIPPGDEFTLCCWERKPERCHRSIAARFLADLGYDTYLL